METVLKEFEDIRIRLEEIKLATGSFDEKKCIGSGGYGKVYKGNLSHAKGRSMAAIKRLNRSQGQGDFEFFKEIRMLTDYKHENLISLLGFCYEGDEAILVYELESHRSLDFHLNSSHLTWSQRLNICVGAAKGLSYLHDPRGTHQRLIHCDIKSGNILLDDHWNAKVADFGLSIMGPANEPRSTVYNLPAGTTGYVDPLYRMTNTLTKESDVYSFGVVLFEVLCGKLCYTVSNGLVKEVLVPIWVESYENNKLNDIIFNIPSIQPMDQICLRIFSNIAYRCLNKSRKDRPAMAEVVTELEAALERQELNQGKAPRFSYETYEKLTKAVEPPLSHYNYEVLLKHILSEGVFLSGHKTWFSLNKKGEHYELISCGECVVPSISEDYPWSSGYNSRFAVGTYHTVNGRFKAHVKSQFLSPDITYTVNLVFKFMVPHNTGKCRLISLRYKLQGETKSTTAYLACEREDGWWMVELFQFTNYMKNVELEILFNGYERPFDVMEVEGIEFRPLEKDDEKLDMQPISDTEATWETKLPTDYEDIMKWSKNSVQWTTKKEAYSIICKGFLINDGKEWFSLDKRGKKCHMLSARIADCIEGDVRRCWPSKPKSRFREAVELEGLEFNIFREINYQLVSFETTYATYLVYKLPRDQSRFEAPIEVNAEELHSNWYIYLRIPQTPVIRQKIAENTHNPLNRPKIKGLPQQRDDGWMEVQIWEFRTATTPEMIPIRLTLTTCGSEALSGLIIEGIEYRPI